MEDTVQDEHSRTLISMLRYELAQYSEVTLMEGTQKKVMHYFGSYIILRFMKSIRKMMNIRKHLSIVLYSI